MTYRCWDLKERCRCLDGLDVSINVVDIGQKLISLVELVTVVRINASLDLL